MYNVKCKNCISFSKMKTIKNILPLQFVTIGYYQLRRNKGVKNYFFLTFYDKLGWAVSSRILWVWRRCKNSSTFRRRLQTGVWPSPFRICPEKKLRCFYRIFCKLYYSPAIIQWSLWETGQVWTVRNKRLLLVPDRVS